MTTTYPGTIDNFDTRTMGQIVEASHVNDLQDAVEAIETELGTQPRHTAAAAPTVNDDSGDGYSVGTIWTDTTNDRIYIAIDVSIGAAVWQEITELAGTWTPVVNQAGVVAATVHSATYRLNAKTLVVECILIVTAAGTGGNGITITGIPAGLAPLHVYANVTSIGTCAIYDNGAAVYWGFVSPNPAGTWALYDSNTRGQIGANPNFALANTDIISLSCVYRWA